MTDEFNFPRDEAERAWLAALPAESAPPPNAENQLVRSLVAAGMLRARPAYLTVAQRLAAAFVIFLLGAAAGAYGARTWHTPPRMATAGTPLVAPATESRDSSGSVGQQIITWY